MRPIFRLTKLAFPRAPKRKEALPPGIEPRPYYAPSHIATTVPSVASHAGVFRGARISSLPCVGGYTKWEHKSKEKGLFRQESNPGPPMRRATSLWHWLLYIRHYLRVEWTSAFKGFHLRKGCTSTAVSGLILAS